MTQLKDPLRLGQVCTSVATSGDAFPTASCSSGTATAGSLTLPTTTTATVQQVGVVSTYVTAMTHFAPMFEIRWQSSDLPSSSTEDQTPSLSSSATANPSPGLSTGAKAGIGTAVPLAVLAMIAAALLLWRRRRTKSRQEAGVAQPKEPSNAGQVEMEQAPSTMIAEMDTTKRPREMPAKTSWSPDRYELPGTH